MSKVAVLNYPIRRTSEQLFLLLLERVELGSEFVEVLLFDTAAVLLLQEVLLPLLKLLYFCFHYL